VWGVDENIHDSVHIGAKVGRESAVTGSMPENGSLGGFGKPEGEAGQASTADGGGTLGVLTSVRLEGSYARSVEGMGGCDDESCVVWQVPAGTHFNGPQAWSWWRPFMTVWAVEVFPPAGGQRVGVLEPVCVLVGGDLYVPLKPGSA
jgi:hypothetical protein